MSLLNLPHEKKFYSMPFPIKEKKGTFICPCLSYLHTKEILTLEFSSALEISIHESHPYLNLQVLHSLSVKSATFSSGQLWLNWGISKIWEKKTIALLKWIKAMPYNSTSTCIMYHGGTWSMVRSSSAAGPLGASFEGTNQYLITDSQ